MSCLISYYFPCYYVLKIYQYELQGKFGFSSDNTMPDSPLAISGCMGSVQLARFDLIYYLFDRHISSIHNKKENKNAEI